MSSDSHPLLERTRPFEGAVTHDLYTSIMPVGERQFFSNHKSNEPQSGAIEFPPLYPGEVKLTGGPPLAVGTPEVLPNQEPVPPSRPEEGGRQTETPQSAPGTDLPENLRTKIAVLFDKGAQNEERLAVVRELVKSGMTSIAGSDSQGNQYSFRLETIPVGSREMVHMFATGPDGKERTSLRGIARADGSFEQQRDRSGNFVSFDGTGFAFLQTIRADTIRKGSDESSPDRRNPSRVPHQHNQDWQAQRFVPRQSESGDQTTLNLIPDREIQRQLPGAVYIGQGEKWLAPEAAKAWLEARQILAADGIDLRANSAGRSNAEQANIYRRYLAGRVALAARPGNSNHERGLSADIANLVDLGTREAQRVMQVLRSVGFVPGDRGRFLKNDQWHWTYRGVDYAAAGRHSYHG